MKIITIIGARPQFIGNNPIELMDYIEVLGVDAEKELLPLQPRGVSDTLPMLKMWSGNLITSPA